MSAAESLYDCSCDYDGYWDVIHTRSVKAARKPYVCCECKCDIRVGEPYENTWGVYEGDACRYRMCARCVDLRDWAKISVPCFCWCYESLHDDVREMVRQVAPDIPGFFMEFGRRMVRIRRRAAAGKAERGAPRKEGA